jgi:hypothetical protein
MQHEHLILIDQLLGVLNIGGEKDVEGSILTELRKQLSRRAGRYRQLDIGLAFMKRRDDFFQGEFKIGRRSDSEFYRLDGLRRLA